MPRYTITVTDGATQQRVVGMTATSRANAVKAAADLFAQHTAPGLEVVVVDTKPPGTPIQTLYRETAAELRDAATRSLDQIVDRFCDTTSLTKWIGSLTAAIEKVDGDPTYDLSWSDAIIKTAGAVFVGRCLRQYRADGMAVGEMVRIATDTALRETRSPSSSSSVPHNLMARYTAAAWAAAAEDLGWVAKTFARAEAAGGASTST